MAVRLVQVAATHRCRVGPSLGVVASSARVLGPENFGEVRNAVAGLAEGLEERVRGCGERGVAHEDLGGLADKLGGLFDACVLLRVEP
ncbi:hypothetical protein [Streptomyces mirabilis]